MGDDHGQKHKADTAEFTRRAAALVPKLAQRRRETLDLRRLPETTVADILDAGFFKIMQPARLGGFELPYGSQVPISAALAPGCGATSWIVSVVATHHWMLAKFDAKAQDDVWAKNPNAYACSAFGFAEANVAKVDGGYKVSGRWTYSSGSNHADWAMIVLAVPRDGQSPERRFAMVPRSEFQALDNWRSVGLRGSGSNDIVVRETFVPDYRTIGFDEIDLVDSPGTKVNRAPSYRLQTFGVFNLTGVGPAIGLAKAALDAFTDGIKQRRGTFGAKLAELQNIQIRVSESSAEIDAARHIAEYHIGHFQQEAMTGKGADKTHILKHQRDCAYIGRLCTRAAERLAEAQGAGGLSEDNPLQQALADIKGVCAHITMGWDANSVPYGKSLLGIEHQGMI
ncbi:MAG: acyl-CoA dehydrogenase family protein [Rhodospirillaceae bacterium]|nr:acyl-CoA dehydrogenase family protein [Rhodospirillaceae bacterium]